MRDLIILKGVEEIGGFFLNRFMNREGINSVLAKDYPLDYKPIKIYNVTGNTRKLMLNPPVKILRDNLEADSTKEKWMNSVYEGSMKALYRANLKDFNIDEEEEGDVPSEKDLIWEALEGEVAIIPDTSSLMDGLISRLTDTEVEQEYVDLHLYLSPMVIKELQRHAMGRAKRFEVKGKKGKEEQLLQFAELKRKARIALRALSELVELRNKKYLRIKVIERKNIKDGVPDWEIISDAKSLHIERRKFFVSNDVIQSTLADVMGLKTSCMYPLHLLNLREINLKGKLEVGGAFYELAVQFGEIIIESPNFRFTIQSDWPNKMSPSWVEKRVYLKVEYNDETLRDEILKIVNRSRYKDKHVEEFDPRCNTLL